MKTLTGIIPGFIYISITGAIITFITVLAIDTVNYNRSNMISSNQRPDELFPKFIKLISFEKIDLDFAGVEFPK